MKKLLILSVALLLAGCATSPIANLNSAVALNTIDGVVNAYGVAISAANTYKSLPLCRTGTKWTATNPCAQRSIIVALQSTAVPRASKAVNDLVAFQKAYPQLDYTNLLAAAQSALGSLQSIMTGAQQ